MNIMPISLGKTESNKISFNGNLRGMKIDDKATNAVNKFVKELRILERNPEADQVQIGNKIAQKDNLFGCFNMQIKDGNNYSIIKASLDNNNKLNSVSISREIHRNPQKIFFRVFSYSKGEIPYGELNPSIEYAEHELTTSFSTHKKNIYKPGMEVAETDSNAIEKLIKSTLKLMGIN